MDEYTRLKNKLLEYINMPDVELSEDEISVYALRELIKTKLEELRKIQFESTFKDEINKSNTIIQKVGRIFKKSNSICEKPCTNIMASSDGKTSNITFCFQNKNSYFGSEYLTICKDFDSDQIYFSQHQRTDKSFVEKHYDRISEHFAILEEFSELYQGGIGGSGKGIGQTVTDGFFSLVIQSDSYGRTSIHTTLTQEEDKEKMYERQWLHRKSLQEIYTENEDTFLKKISVPIASLNYTYKTIAETAISKNNVPQLVKRK